MPEVLSIDPTPAARALAKDAGRAADHRAFRHVDAASCYLREYCRRMAS